MGLPSLYRMNRGTNPRGMYLIMYLLKKDSGTDPENRKIRVPCLWTLLVGQGRSGETVKRIQIETR